MTLDRNTLLEAAKVADKKSTQPENRWDDYEYWSGYAKGREDVATELRALAATLSAGEGL